MVIGRVFTGATWPLAVPAALLLLTGCGPGKPAVAASSAFQEFCRFSYGSGLNVCITYDPTAGTVTASARQSAAASCQTVHLLVAIDDATAADRGPVALCGDWLEVSAPLAGDRPPPAQVCAIVNGADGELARQCHNFAGMGG